MERFLRYSLEKSKKIRVVWMDGGQLRQATAAVLAYDGGNVMMALSGKKAPLTVALADILSCDYARGDHGEE
ncbi:MAG TPA: hypothetical protein PKJ47_11280 [Candidatus Limiplasma sp.]|nr:hypothetical protein [Candidatus Limiplasma sp.]